MHARTICSRANAAVGLGTHPLDRQQQVLADARAAARGRGVCPPPAPSWNEVPFSFQEAGPGGARGSAADALPPAPACALSLSLPPPAPSEHALFKSGRSRADRVCGEGPSSPSVCVGSGVEWGRVGCSLGCGRGLWWKTLWQRDAVCLLARGVRVCGAVKRVQGDLSWKRLVSVEACGGAAGLWQLGADADSSARRCQICTLKPAQHASRAT